MQIINNAADWINPYIDAFSLPAPLNNPYVLLLVLIVFVIISISSVINFLSDIRYRKRIKKNHKRAVMQKKIMSETVSEQDQLRQFQTQQQMMILQQQMQLNMMTMTNNITGQPQKDINAVPLMSAMPAIPVTPIVPTVPAVPVVPMVTNASGLVDQVQPLPENPVIKKDKAVKTVKDVKMRKPRVSIKDKVAGVITIVADKLQDIKDAKGVTCADSKVIKETEDITPKLELTKPKSPTVEEEVTIPTEPEIQLDPIKDVFNDLFTKNSNIYSDLDELQSEIPLIDDIVPDVISEQPTIKKYNLDDLQPVNFDDDDVSTTDNDYDDGLSEFEKLKLKWTKNEEAEIKKQQTRKEQAEIIKINQQVLDAQLDTDLKSNNTVSNTLTPKQKKALEAKQKEIDKRKKAALKGTK